MMHKCSHEPNQDSQYIVSGCALTTTYLHRALAQARA